MTDTDSEQYNWKTMSSTIIIDRSDEDGVSFVELLKQKQICFYHGIKYSLMGSDYRKYKRGKNRCLFCGVKID